LEIGTWLVTFLLTVFADLTVAVEAGMILAARVLKVTETTTVSQVIEEYLKVSAPACRKPENAPKHHGH
jgi:SulP family sulfate permease